MRNVFFLLASLGPALAQGLTFPEYKQVVFSSQLNVVYQLEPQYTEEARQAGREGTVVLYVEVAPNGLAERIRVLRSLGFGLNENAVEAVQHWIFEPEFRNGTAVTAGTVVFVDFRLPVESRPSAKTTVSEVFRLGPSSGITPPRIISRVEPVYTEQARKAHLQGTIVLYVEVTPEGQLQNVQLLQGLGMGVDELAVERISQWRFEPATKEGKPVTVVILVEANFSLG